MIQYIDEQRTYRRTLAYVCDVCKTTYDDELEMQEFQHINFIGGYNSVFGDEERVVCDICQHCLKKMIGEYYRTDDEEQYFGSVKYSDGL